MGWSGDAPSPDPAIGEAAKTNAQLGKDAFEWYKNYYNNTVAPLQQRQTDLAESLTNDYLDTSRQQKEFAKEQNAYYKSTFQPVEQQMVRDAMDYDSAANIQRASGEAAANVNQQFSNARGQSARLAGRYGLTSTAFSGPAGASERAQALGAAGAATGAATQTRDKGIALRSGVANFGRNMPNTSAQYFAGSNASNQGAMGATGQAFSGGINAGNFMNQGFGLGMQGNQSAGNLLLGDFNGRMQGYSANQQAVGGFMQGLGMLGGAAITASDRRLKTNIKRVGTTPGGAPVYEYNYIWGGPRQRGVMAQDIAFTQPWAVGMQDGHLAVNYSMVR
jgi:hypothetical protein